MMGQEGIATAHMWKQEDNFVEWILCKLLSQLTATKINKERKNSLNIENYKSVTASEIRPACDSLALGPVHGRNLEDLRDRD